MLVYCKNTHPLAVVTISGISLQNVGSAHFNVGRMLTSNLRFPTLNCCARLLSSVDGDERPVRFVFPGGLPCKRQHHLMESGDSEGGSQRILGGAEICGSL